MNAKKLLMYAMTAMLLAWATPIQAQIDSLDAEQTHFVLVDKEPAYPGGVDALYQYLGSHIIYPEKAKAERAVGTVIVTFVVEKDGSISNIKVLKDPGYGMSEEVVRVISQMPRWTPAMQQDKPVRAAFSLPVVFRLEAEKETKHKGLFRRRSR
ncbi:MAG: energy transducer TonB [Bacteroidales bacterium]|nr:energy transducer TonB [Bacteroidales bacterium]